MERRHRSRGVPAMTADPYAVYNALVDHMCAHCNRTVFRKCGEQSEDARCKCVIRCMTAILKRDDEEYPIKVPTVKQ